MSFAGKYLSIFCPNQGDIKENLRDLTLAIRQIYASVFGPDALMYRRRVTSARGTTRASRPSPERSKHPIPMRRHDSSWTDTSTSAAIDRKLVATSP